MSAALSGLHKAIPRQRSAGNASLITGINLNLSGVYKMGNDFLMSVGGYKIDCDTRNYVVRKKKANEDARGGFFTTLYGAINYISEEMLKEKLSSNKISKIDDLKVVIKEHNKAMLEMVTVLDRS